MGFLTDSKNKLSVLVSLWGYMREYKKWWLGPLFLMLILFGFFVAVTAGSAVAPFIYTLF